MQSMGGSVPVPRFGARGLLAATGAVAFVHLATVWALSEVLVRSEVRRPYEALVGVLVPPAPVTPPAPLPVEPPKPPPPPMPTPPRPRPVKPVNVAPPPPTPAPMPVVEGPPSERSVTLPPPRPEAPAVPPVPVADAADPVAAAADPVAAATEPVAAASPAPPPLPVTPPRSDASHLNNPAPVYPALSRRLGEQGRVLFDVHILADGSVGQVRLRRSSGHPRLDQAALEAVRHWRYQPARRGGEPISYWHVQPVEFSLGS
jgi:protein TonB